MASGGGEDTSPKGKIFKETFYSIKGSCWFMILFYILGFFMGSFSFVWGAWFPYDKEQSTNVSL